MIRLFLIVQLFLIQYCLFAQADQYKLYNISKDEGLPSDNLHYVYQDSYGFLWIASFEGLFKWDGHRYKKYTHNEEDSSSISNNIVYYVFEDYKKRLWIGTLDGLNLYNREKDQFIKCILTSELERIPVNVIVEDHQNQLWLGTSNGLFHYDHDKKQTRWYKPEPGNKKSLSDEVIFGLAVDQNDCLWMSTFHGGVNKFDPLTQSFTSFLHHENQSSTICSNVLRTVMVDHENRIWVGSYDKGVTLLSNEGKVLKHYLISSDLTRPVNGQNGISVIYEDKENKIWLGATTEKLQLLDKKKDLFIPFNPTPFKKTEAEFNSIVAIHEDNFGNIWFATQSNGLFYTNKSKNIFQHYFKENKNKIGLKGKIITCFYESPNGDIWVGTSGGGLSLFDRKKKTFKSYTTKDGLSSNDIYDVKEDKDGNLWVATWGGGISKFDKKKQKFISFVSNPENPKSLIYNNIKSILPDDSIIWIGTHGEGLAAYDLKKKIFIHYKNNAVFPFNMKAPAWINHLYKDSRNRIWISTYSGVFLYDRKKLEHFGHTKTKTSISNNSVNMVLEDAAGRIWVVSEAGGIDVFNEKKRNFLRYNSCSKSFKAITCDRHGKLWLSSNEGLVVIDPKNRKLKRYDISDGLQGNSFFHKSVLKSKSGHLFFGGSNGFNIFHPDSIKSLEYHVKPYLTTLYIYDHLVNPGEKDSPLKKVLAFTDTLVLRYDQTFFSIGFTAINLYSAEKTQFQYKLEGLHNNWIKDYSERKASFTNLDPGTYQFKIKYTGVNGEWQEAPKALTIIILPPWWKTWWFKILLIFSIFGSILCFFYLRLSSIKKHNKELEGEVKNRTHELMEANEFLVERNQEINRQSQKIMDQQDQILFQNQELEKTVEELKKLHQTKDRFFSILAHDLKNPVAALAGVIESLRTSLPGLSKKQIDEYLATLQKSSQGVYTLLTNLLNWAITQSKKIEHSPADFSLLELVQKNKLLLEQQFEQKNLSLMINIDPSHKVFADYSMMDVVVRNLISNSIKFTNSDGRVSIKSREVEREILLSVSDNGVGMTKEQIENLFHLENSSFSKGTAGETGTGLGLIIVREFILANKGSISVESTHGKGSTFKIRLPKSRKVNIDEQTHTHQEEQVGNLDEVSIEKIVKLKGKKILIIDDNKELRDYLKLILSPVFELFEAKNGREGFELAQEIQPTVIISDLIMPEMDGIEFCKKAKNTSEISHIPLILLTSQSDEESQLSGYEAGADVYLTKPVKKNLLFQVILNFIENQEKLRQKILNSADFFQDGILTNKLDEEFMKNIFELIEENLSDPNLDHRVISEKMSMSKSVLYNKFKAITGQGVHEFIKTIRLKKSLQLLAEGKLPISQVALEVGFNSQSYFNKCFIKQYGKTPKAYFNKKGVC